ncbi:MAG: sulfatase [Pseudomonadota bacterium]
MIHRLRNWLLSDIAQTILLIPAVAVAILLPLDFLAQIDAYLKASRPIELLSVFAWGWVFYASLGFILTAGAVGVSWFIAKAVRRSPAILASRVVTWLSTTLVLFGILSHGGDWLEAKSFAGGSWLSQPRLTLGMAIIVGSAICLWRRFIFPIEMKQLMRFSAAGGLVLTVISPLIFWSAFPISMAMPANTKISSVKSPHIVLITVDTFSANHLSLYGYPRETTPNLNSLAQQSSVFERYYANSNFTTTAVNSFINGVRPWTHRALQQNARVDAVIAARGLVARLKNAGYQTLAVSTNPYAAPFHNRADEWLDRGVYGRVHVSAFIANSQLSSRIPGASPILSLKMIGIWIGPIDKLLVRTGIWSVADHFDPELALSSARQLVEARDTTKPMFLWVHLLQPHGPYASQAPFVGRFDDGPDGRTRFDSKCPYGFVKESPAWCIARYDEAIASVDYHLGRFIGWLKDNKVFDDSLLIISADHGESFSHGFGGHAGPLLHDDLIRIPLIVKEPGQSTGKRLGVLAEQIDLMPTILDLTGIPIDQPIEGRSLKPALLGEKVEKPVFSMNLERNDRFGKLQNGSVTMIDGHWKYVRYLDHPAFPKMPMLVDSLYDLKNDPSESVNLAAVAPEVAANMRTAIEAQLQLHGGPLQ